MGIAVIPCLRSVIAPVNYRKLVEYNIVDNLEEEISKQKDRFVITNNFLLYELDPFVKSVYDHFVKISKAADTPDKRKICLQTVVNSLFILQRDTMNAAIFRYYKDILQFLLEINVDEYTLDTDGQNSYNSALAYLSKVLYPKEGLELVFLLLEKALNHPHYRVRENAIAFLSVNLPKLY